MKTVGIHTLGCRVNQYESISIAERLTEQGFQVMKTDAPCDYYILNTCAVTGESQRQSRQLARRLAARGKTAVLGCASQNAKEEFLSIPNVFYVGGCSQKGAVVDAICQDLREQRVEDMAGAPYEPMHVEGTSSLFSSCRAYIKIQDGCSGHCTYCIIPTLRGPSRSRPAAEIVEEARRLVERGYREVVLTGIETSAYNDVPLWKLIDQLGKLQKDGLERVRLGSISPGSVQGEFLRAIAESPNFMPHLHISLQSGSDRVLRAMRRPYTRGYALERVALLRQAVPQMQIGADFITGFPTETEEEYAETESFVREARLFHVHAFPFSPREGTPAATMDGQVSPEERKKRCGRLLAVSAQLCEELMQEMVGRTACVLVEKLANGAAVGHTESFIECHVPLGGENCCVGDLLPVRLVGTDGGHLVGSHVAYIT